MTSPRKVFPVQPFSRDRHPLPSLSTRGGDREEIRIQDSWSLASFRRVPRGDEGPLAFLASSQLILSQPQERPCENHWSDKKSINCSSPRDVVILLLLFLRSHGLQPTRLLCPWDFPGKDAEVGCHFLLQGIFPTQGSNPHLPFGRQILYR